MHLAQLSVTIWAVIRLIEVAPVIKIQYGYPRASSSKVPLLCCTITAIRIGHCSIDTYVKYFPSFGQNPLLSVLWTYVTKTMEVIWM